MYRVLFLLIIATLCFGATPIMAQQTPPIMPNIQEPPLPVPIELGPPSDIPSDVPNRPLTADEAVGIALSHQPGIAIATSGVAAAQGRERQARSDLLPSLVLSAGHNTVNTSASSGSVFGNTGYQNSASVRQLLFDFNHTREVVRQVRAQKLSAMANLTRAQSDLALQVKQAFYSYVQNQRLADVSESNVRNRQGHLALAQARLKSGMGLPADVVRAETAVADSLLGLSQARANAISSRINLALVMGIDPRTPLKTSDAGETSSFPADLGSLVDMAIKQRPEITQAQANMDAASHGVGAARTGNAPILTANAGVGQRGTSFPMDGHSSVIGVSIQFVPFDSGLTSGRVAEAQAGLQSAQAQFQATKLSVISDVSQAYLNLETARQRVATAEAGLANAEESVRLVQGRYQAGMGTFIDVLDAQTALETARGNRVNALSAVEQAKAALAHSINADLGKTAAKP